MTILDLISHCIAVVSFVFIIFRTNKRVAAPCRERPEWLYKIYILILKLRLWIAPSLSIVRFCFFHHEL